jgi:hypothetical protein
MVLPIQQGFQGRSELGMCAGAPLSRKRVVAKRIRPVRGRFASEILTEDEQVPAGFRTEATVYSFAVGSSIRANVCGPVSCTSALNLRIGEAR